jgi:methionine-S-sulfoxide reductase
MEKAYFAAGCFWGVEHIFRDFDGVHETSVGYCNGLNANPSYESICSGTSGHAEAVEVIFDSQKIKYIKLVEIFFDLHDPTTLNRQGPDIGSQYRSGIYYISAEQEQYAKSYINKIDTQKNIVTEVTPLQKYWRAEEYHQQYFEKNPNSRVCHIYSPSK